MKGSVKHTSISTVMSELESYEICAGLNKTELAYSKCEDPTATGTCSSCNVIRHTIPLKPEHYEEDGSPFQASIYIRSPDCELLCGDSSCSSCSKQEKAFSKQNEKSKVQPPVPLKDKADGGDEVTPHMRVFREQQRKLLASPKFGKRYHPHIIRFCLSIHAKSPAAYR